MANTILYIGSSGERAPVNLTLAGRTDPESSIPIRRTEQSETIVFQYITSGRGVFSLGARHYEPESGDFLIVPPRQAHAYSPDPRDPWGKIWINVTGPLPEELLRIYALSGHCYFPDSSRAGAVLNRLLDGLQDISPESSGDFTARGILEIVQTLSCARSAPSVPESAAVLRDFLRGCIGKRTPALAEMAEKVRLSPIQTIRMFHRAFGITPGAFFLREKVEAAAYLLSDSENSLKEIAGLTGFQSEYYFSRIFKREKGIPPGEFRRRSREGWKNIGSR